MKKLFLTFAAIYMTALSTNAQTIVNFGSSFGVPSGTVALNDPIAKAADGVALIGDCRSNVEEGHAAGLSYAKKTAYYNVEGQNIKTEAAVNMVKYPSGVQKKYEILPAKTPVNRSIMFKAATDGKVQVFYSSKKGAGRLFMGVFRNGKWEYLGEAKWEKGSTLGTAGNPYQPLALDYPVMANDVVMLFAGSAVDVAGFYYSGQLDKEFKGEDPHKLTSKKKSSKKSK